MSAANQEKAKALEQAQTLNDERTKLAADIEHLASGAFRRMCSRVDVVFFVREFLTKP